VTIGADAPSFEYRDGTVYREKPMRSLITMNSTESYHAACVAGLGIIQSPRSGVLPSIAAGRDGGKRTREPRDESDFGRTP
jgi:hypothetical protein